MPKARSSPGRLRHAAWLLSLAALGCGLMLAACGRRASSGGAGEVVLFTSLDPLYSEPIVREYERRSGVKVRLVTDTEAAKTVGLVNRLIARKDHPEADVFWNNELAQSLVLREAGVLDPYRPASAQDLPASYRDPGGYWTGFAARARVIVYNTQLVPVGEAPHTLEDLVHPRFRGRVAVARPLFGTTFAHAAVLFARRGPEQAQAYFRALKANDAVWPAGNAMVCDLVARGEKAVGLTDTDDVRSAQRKGLPVALVYPDQDGDGALLIPNSVVLVRGGPNPERAKQLIEFLASAEVEGLLAQSDSAQIPLRAGVRAAGPEFDLAHFKAMEVDWAAAARHFPAVKAFVERELME